MSEINIFEQASRLGLTVQSEMGVLNVTNLWGLALTKLDKIAVDLRRQLREQEEGSFIQVKAADSDHTELKFRIVKHIIDVRLAENEAKVQAKAKADQRKLIAEIIARKEGEALEGKNLEELRAMLKD